MPKSPEVLKAEAIARKRRIFPIYQQAFIDAQPGGKSYQYALQMHDRAHAEREADLALARFMRIALEAGLDVQGNPLP